MVNAKRLQISCLTFPRSTYTVGGELQGEKVHREGEEEAHLKFSRHLD